MKKPKKRRVRLSDLQVLIVWLAIGYYVYQRDPQGLEAFKGLLFGALRLVEGYVRWKTP